MILIKKNEQKIVTNYSQEVYKVKDDIVLFVDKTNDKVVDYNFCNQKYIVKRNGKLHFKRNTVLYKYYPEVVLDKIKTELPVNIFDKVKPLKLEKILEQSEIDINRILRFDMSNHLIYRIGKEEPISGVYLFNHCTGRVTNKKYDIDELEKHLKKLKEVLSVTNSEVPYYNREFYGHRELVITVRLEQDIFDEIWNKVKDNKFPSIRVKEEIIGMFDANVIDPLGMKQYQLSQKQIDKIETMIEEYNNYY